MSNTELLASLYDAFGRGDVPSVLALMDAEIHWHEAEGNPYMPSGEAWVGPDAVVNNLFVRLAEEWDGFTVTPGSFHDAGDVVAVEGRYTGTYEKTGKSLDAQFCHLWTLKDGKIVKFQQYGDMVQLRDAMGVSGV
jgi:ketosteroid isomerase-like protein